MVTINSTGRGSVPQTESPFHEFKDMLDSADAPALLDRMDEYRHGVGRRGYSNKTLWRAYLASFILNLPSTNELIRRLQEDSALREVCGFGDSLPHRTTFNRFINRLADHQDLIEAALLGLTNDLKTGLPGLGDVVAVDSTVVESYSNPNKKQVSDAHATWTAKPSEKNPNELEWFFGYKFHLMVDARHGVPITGFTTTASKQDTQFLSPLMDKAQGQHEWFQPNFVVADKGYDSAMNHRGGNEARGPSDHSGSEAERRGAKGRHLPRRRNADLHGDGRHEVHQERSETWSPIRLSATGLSPEVP